LSSTLFAPRSGSLRRPRRSDKIRARARNRYRYRYRNRYRYRYRNRSVLEFDPDPDPDPDPGILLLLLLDRILGDGGRSLDQPSKHRDDRQTMPVESVMVEDRFTHSCPIEYEYEYRFTEYEYDLTDEQHGNRLRAPLR
jgi:hypothetical protein